jgi:putative addiction module killer protein
MIEVRQTAVFAEYLTGLRDKQALARIVARIDRLAAGNPGDVKPIGNGLSELRIDYGPGYRVYFTQQGKILVVLLCGGNKKTQKRDIALAKELAEQL